METYEITYLVESIEKSKAVKDMIHASGATYKEIKDWGERDLVYPIKGHIKALYFTGEIKTFKANINEIKKKLNYGNEAMRYVILAIESK